MIHVVGQNYPSLGDILDHYSNVIRTLEITKGILLVDRFNRIKCLRLSLSTFKSTKVSGKPSTLENFFVKPTLASYKCNFYRCNSHSTFYCKKYPAQKDRLQQSRAAKLCIYCSNPAHNTKQCPSKNGYLYPC